MSLLRPISLFKALHLVFPRKLRWGRGVFNIVLEDSAKHNLQVLAPAFLCFVLFSNVIRMQVL